MTEEVKEGMTIVEGMKLVRVLEKRMEANNGKITQYASMVSTERPNFIDEVTQEKEIVGLLQANEDHLKTILKLKDRIDGTNLAVTVEIEGTTYSINQLLTLKRRMVKKMLATYNSLNDSVGRSRHMGSVGSSSERGQVIRLYDEKRKNEKLKKWQELEDTISSRLEVINAVTKLVD